METLRKFPFSALFETEVLALLLQVPAVFDDYPDLWAVDFFMENDHRSIMQLWLKIRYYTGRAPSLASLENEITMTAVPQEGKEDRYEEKYLTLKDQETLRELRRLFSIPVERIDREYIAEALTWQRYTRMTNSISASVDLLQSGKMDDIPSLILDALNTGHKSVLAGDDFYDTVPNIPEEVFPGILHVESIGLLLGASKAHKTWNLLNAAVASAMGKSWMGFSKCTPKRTLYCNLEIHEEQLKARLDLVCACYGITRADLKEHLDVLNLKGRSNGIEAVLLSIRNFSRKLGNLWRLIVIDPIYKLYANSESKDGKTSENDLGTIGVMFERLERIAKELHSAILLAHHFKKGNSAETALIDLGAGSGGFGRGPDALIALRPLEESGTWRCETVLRYFPPVEPFGLRLEFPRLVRDDLLDLDEVRDRTGAPTKYRLEDLLALLTEEGLTNKEWAEEAEEEIGVKEKTFRALRDEAVAQNFAEARGDVGKRAMRYFLTEAGKNHLANKKQAVSAGRVSALKEKLKEMKKAKSNGNGEKQ